MTVNSGLASSSSFLFLKLPQTHCSAEKLRSSAKEHYFFVSGVPFGCELRNGGGIWECIAIHRGWDAEYLHSYLKSPILCTGAQRSIVRYVKIWQPNVVSNRCN